MLYKGILKHEDLEGGFWSLDGEYQLVFEDENVLSSYKTGDSVEIEGSIEKDVMGFGMVGQILFVRDIKLAD